MVPTYLSRKVLRMKYRQTSFALVLMHIFHKTVYTIVCKVSWGVSTKASFSIDFPSIKPPALSSLEFPSLVDISFNPFWKGKCRLKLHGTCNFEFISTSDINFGTEYFHIVFFLIIGKGNNHKGMDKL